MPSQSIGDAANLDEARARAGHANPDITQSVYRRKPELATVEAIEHIPKKY